MSQNFLQLNESKSEILLFAPPDSTLSIQAQLGTLSNNVKTSARNLGVWFDSNLSFDGQVTRVVQACFIQLRNISKIKSFLTFTDLQTVINALITSRLDYCNSLYSGLSKKVISRLQLIQNSAARLLTNTRRRDHITPVLASLHWLPVSFRIDFKILLTTFKALRGLAPSYISDMLTPYEPVRSLRSSDKGLLTPYKAKLVTRGGRAFKSQAPSLWNALPQALRDADSVTSFKRLLKTYFYTKAFL